MSQRYPGEQDGAITVLDGIDTTSWILFDSTETDVDHNDTAPTLILELRDW